MVRDKPHILVRQSPAAERYRPHPQKMDIPVPSPPKNPRAHAAELKRALTQAAAEAQTRRDESGITIAGATPGIYVIFQGRDGLDLKLESLDAQGSGIELVCVGKEAGTEKAIVFVPDGKVKYFLKKFEDYATAKTRKGKRKNKDLVERIAQVRLATLRALWTDPAKFPDEGRTVWWEVWLRTSDGHEEERFRQYANRVGIEIGKDRLTFPDRIVLLARGTPRQLTASLDVLNDLAEIRAAKEVVQDLHDMAPAQQAEVAKDLLARLRPAPANAPAVCILDTGVNNTHPLLAGSLLPADLHACDPAWKSADHDGHGTEMAGLALYGDLAAFVRSSGPAILRHRLESVKILPPPPGQNRPELYGAITAEAVSRVEIKAPTRRRGFSLAVTADANGNLGKPTSWSAAIDALAAGRSFDPSPKGLAYLADDKEGPRRLFVVCAGNVNTTEIDHLARSDTEEIREPGQAWNALTVGACTELVNLDPRDPLLRGHRPVAQAGDLSPYSSTSLLFERKWPMKPDVVFEGGNKAHDGRHAVQVDCLSLVSTHFKPQEKMFVPTWATSASAAQVARFTGILAAQYPGLWPETIRALIVHSAEWTPRMLSYAGGARNRGEKERLLLRRFGFGVPSADRALRSARNALTLVVQDRLRPFENTKLCEMKLHELPWPKPELAALGNTKVRMRVTLSYFVEPNPGRRGWRNRYRYASHGLRFDVVLPTESVPEFRKRLNKMALAEDEDKPDTSSDAAEWSLGPHMRHRGSLHADTWEGPAIELAERGAIGIYPVSGWWKDQPKRDRSALGVRYALVVSIDAPEVNVDIWTPVALQVGIPVEVSTTGE
jgi:hypothetical protein